MSWTYVYSRETELGGFHSWGIREAYLNKDGELVSWTLNTMTPWGQYPDELSRELDRMKEAREYEFFLDIKGDEAELKLWSDA